MTDLLFQLPAQSAARRPHSPALSYRGETLTYRQLAEQIECVSSGLLGLGLSKQARVAIYFEKRFENVIATFGCSAAGGVFVPVNPLLKPEQVGYILRDCAVQMLVTSLDRFHMLQPMVGECPQLRQVILTDSKNPGSLPAATGEHYSVHAWQELLDAPPCRAHRIIDNDLTAILYTSGSTGKPKGVVLSHRNMVAGAKSVASYLQNNQDDVMLAALPLSFDAGFSQLTTAFHVGARAALINYVLPQDVVQAVVREQVTGLTAVPPLWIQLSQAKWPEGAARSLRYFANTGGRMPLETLKVLRGMFPSAKPYLMYGLTEAFRATYLDPSEVDQRPDSIGKAIPNSDVMVLREDGQPCAPDEPGELVQRGALVAQGYWNDPEKTAERFRPLPRSARPDGIVIDEMAVFSGDTVRLDKEGFIYFIGRHDEMIKTSGYRVSPTEIEEMAYATQWVAECAAFGVPHPVLGQAIVLIVTPNKAGLSKEELAAYFKQHCPAYQLPAIVDIRPGSLPRNPNGKIDRKTLAVTFLDAFQK